MERISRTNTVTVKMEASEINRLVGDLARAQDILECASVDSCDKARRETFDALEVESLLVRSEAQSDSAKKVGLAATALATLLI